MLEGQELISASFGDTVSDLCVGDTHAIVGSATGLHWCDLSTGVVSASMGVSGAPGCVQLCSGTGGRRFVLAGLDGRSVLCDAR